MVSKHDKKNGEFIPGLHREKNAILRILKMNRPFRSGRLPLGPNKKKTRVNGKFFKC